MRILKDNDIISEELLNSIHEFIAEWNNSSDHIEVHTSGSTGKAQKIFLKKNHCINSAHKTIDYLNINKGSTAALCLSTTTIAGKMMVIRSIVGDLNLRVLPVNSNPLKDVDGTIDFIALVPLQLQTILTESPEKLKSISKIIVGGGRISKQLEDLLIENELTVYHTYGMTETISHVAMRKVGIQHTEHFEALPGISFTQKNENLVIHYPEIDQKEIQTTDRVKLIDNQHFIWLGRTDFVINSGGIKFQAEEIERKLEAYISEPFFISGIEDDKLGEKLILIIESEDKFHFDKNNWEEALSKFEIPKEIFILPKFIYTASGKINRIETKKLISEHVPS